MRKQKLDDAIRKTYAAVLDLADITVKPHFEPDNKQVLSALLRISMELPIYAMEDDSAIFIYSVPKILPSAFLFSI